jgi:Tubulin like
MSLYIVAIGGTGAKCVESIIHLAAAGLLGQEKVQVLFIDPDESNGNLTRTRETLTIYQACRRAIAATGTSTGIDTPWMQTPIESLEVWSPFSGSINKSLGTYFNYESYQFNNPGLGHLFDVLYTPGEREADLDVGFRGRPAIGSAIMSQVRLDDTRQDPWRSLMQAIELELGAGGSARPRIFICGSIFGGTGASGFPTIGRLLKNKLERSAMSDRVKMGGLLMLPYFQFNVPAEQDPGSIYARPEQFLLNTEAALRYYQAQPIFDSIYLLGDQEPASVAQFSIGKNTQKNDPHFIELYAALAARHFLTQDDLSPVVLLSRQDGQRITWEDIPDKAQVKTNLANTVRFAYLWLANLSPELDKGKSRIKQFQKEAPWYSRFFKPQGLFLGGKGMPDLNEDLQQDTIQCINAWSLSVLRWIYLMHGSGGNNRSIQLFRHSLLMDTNGEVPQITENFSKLVLGADNLEQSKDVTPQAIKEKLITLTPDPPTGVAGLATTLYSLCKP